MLEIVDGYGVKWKMLYNATKSVIVIFRMKRKIVQPAIQFKVSGHVIPIKDSVTYGGVRLTYNLSTKENMLLVCSRTKQILHSLSSLGLRYRDIEALIQLSVRRFGTG
jgi:hypothetical protein